MKVGVMVTYNIGTGLVIARREDGSWSPPSAVSSFGVGWGAQVTKLFCFLPISIFVEISSVSTDYMLWLLVFYK